MSKKGFTLLELLIAVTILGIVSAAGFITYSKAQSISRDARTKQDLKAIASALELYRIANKSYPATPDGDDFSPALGSSQPQPWIPGLTPNYLSSVPIHPGESPYAYISNNASAYSCAQAGHPWYLLLGFLENSNDPERLANRPDIGFCNGTTTAKEFFESQAPGFSENIFVIFEQN